MKNGSLTHQQTIDSQRTNGRKSSSQLKYLALFASLFIVVGNCIAASLTHEQIVQSRVLADHMPWPSATLIATHPLGLQTLSIEKQEQKHSTTTRRVNVYQYHYNYRSARLVSVDLRDGVISHQTMINSVHLPLNQTEIDFAISLVAYNASLLKTLRAEQERRGQTPFANLDELDIKASIFEPLDSQHPCASERCALLSLFDQTRTVFSVEPVVLLNSIRLDILGRP